MKTLRILSALVIGAGLLACGDGGGDVAVGVGDVAAGKVSYDKRCAQCHGDGGDARGSGANFMLPRPRIFAENSSYKFRLTNSGELPTDRDLFDIITRGLPGTAMPGFDVIPEQERWDLVAYIKSLNEDFADPEMTETALPVDELAGQVEVPELTDAMAEAGQAIYESNKCWQCHGRTGRGNGESFPDLKDDFPYFDDEGGEIAPKTPILPTNLTNPEMYRGGAEPFDIFRAVSSGLNGTPMPAYRESITVEDRWNLVAYMVNTFHPPKKEQKDEVMRAKRVESFPEGSDDESWSDAPVARFQLLANVIEPPRLFWTSVDYVMVQGMYTDTELSLRIQWDDRTHSEGGNIGHEYADRDTSIYAGTDHPDQFALQFPARADSENKVRPYFLFGDSKRATNLWWWTAHDDAFRERNGKGYAALKDQPQSSQSLRPSVTWDDGRYTMVVTRTLLTDDPKNDAQFTPGAFLPIAFHAWDGDRGEVGQRRNLSTWYWLQLEPQIPPKQKYVAPTTFAISFLFMLLLVRWVRRRNGASSDQPPPSRR